MDGLELYDENELGDDKEVEIDWDAVNSLQTEFDRIAEIEDPIERLHTAHTLLEGVE